LSSTTTGSPRPRSSAKRPLKIEEKWTGKQFVYEYCNSPPPPSPPLPICDPPQPLESVVARSGKKRGPVEKFFRALVKMNTPRGKGNKACRQNKVRTKIIIFFYYRSSGGGGKESCNACSSRIDYFFFYIRFRSNDSWRTITPLRCANTTKV